MSVIEGPWNGSKTVSEDGSDGGQITGAQPLPTVRRGGRVRVISSFPPKSHTPEGSGVEVGKGVRASINRIGDYLELIDGMRGEVPDVMLETQLGVIEGALASIVFMYQPPPKRTA